jgi:hypothetical protein
MTTLVFLFSIAVIFGSVLALEVKEKSEVAFRRPVGLVAWLTGGNWPAKIGGGLLVVGVGALLRYALINLDVSNTLKLGTGVLAAGALGLAATLTRVGAGRRAVSLALAGAAFGVAYLTAYSAFGLFHYLDNVTGVGLLAVTALGAGVYAITRGALSLALLAMVGAYLAPAFAVSDPGPAVVYGYYVAASLLSLIMVAARGWRPLIHLSFLFTLAGGAFFAWTARYFTAEHASVMLPAVLALAAVHVLMPVAERRGAHGVWLERLDLVYALSLPVAAALSAWLVSASRASLSGELLALGAIWFAVAGYLLVQGREGVALHALIGLLLAGIGGAVRFRDLPWELIALTVSVGALWLAARRSSSSDRLLGALAGVVPLTGFLHVISSLSQPPGATVFLNERFVERLFGAGLLMVAGQACRRARQSLDTLLWSVGVGWALVAIGSELLRWDLVALAPLLHWALLCLVIALAILRTPPQATSTPLVILPVAVLFTASWAAMNASAVVSWVSLALAPTALVALSVRRAGVERATQVGRALCAVIAPLTAGIWAAHLGTLERFDTPQFALTIVLLVLLLTLITGRLLLERSSDWLGTAAEMAAFVFAATLLYVTTLSISRAPWGMALELLALVGMLWLVYADRPSPVLPRWLAPGSALGVALVLQAYLLRWLGPPGSLDVWDIPRMRSPTLASLLWAIMGGLLTVWGRRHQSRPVWAAGAALLVASALKLVLLDFGSLGQLTNIVAVIGAGIVFMLVGWLAPMPPAARPEPQPAPQPASRDAAAVPAAAAGAQPLQPPAPASRKTAWTIVIVALLLLPLVQCTSSALRLLRTGLGLARADAVERVEPAPVPRAEYVSSAPRP